MSTSRLKLIIVATGVVVLAGCSAPARSTATQPAAAVAASAVAPTPPATTAAVGAPGDTGPTSRLITAAGTGTVTGTPDVMTVVLGVETTAVSATVALSDNNTRAAAVIAVLKKGGVAPADLQTSQLSINPLFDNKNHITGYQVNNVVTANLRQISTAGSLIDAVGKAAGNAVRVQQLSFSIGDDSALRAKARADAVRQAQAQAKQMADAAGVRLGQIRSITETPNATPISYAAAASSAAAPGSVPIEKGSQQLTVVVQVIYEIAD